MPKDPYRPSQRDSGQFGAQQHMTAPWMDQRTPVNVRFDDEPVVIHWKGRPPAEAVDFVADHYAFLARVGPVPWLVCRVWYREHKREVKVRPSLTRRRAAV